MNGKHSLTATNLAIYQHLNCDLYIHNVSSGTIPGSPRQFKSFGDFEGTLQAWIGLGNCSLLLARPVGPSAEGSFDPIGGQESLGEHSR
jgi:hypothetical protein